MRLVPTKMTPGAKRRGRPVAMLGRLAVGLFLLPIFSSLVSLAAAQPALAQPLAGTFASSSSAGPVGTIVRLSGQLDPGCMPSSGTIEIDFEGYGQTRMGGVDEFTAAVSAGGSFAVSYRIPSVLGGAATRGLYGFPATPGLYQFQYTEGPTCEPSAVVAFHVTGPAVPTSSSFDAIVPAPGGHGYWLAQANGSVDSYGAADFFGSLPGLGVSPNAPISAMAATPDGKGYWLAGADGAVYAFGDARFLGSLPGIGVDPYGPIVSMAATPDGRGYWLLGADGGVFAFGDATYAGSGIDWMSPFESIGATAAGYDIATSHLGQVWFYPGGNRLTSLPSLSTLPLVASLTGAAFTPSGDGGWQVGLDGGVFAFGDAGFYGSLPGLDVAPVAPVVAVAATPDGHGYWLLGSDGGVFAFGDAGFYGSGA